MADDPTRFLLEDSPGFASGAINQNPRLRASLLGLLDPQGVRRLPGFPQGVTLREQFANPLAYLGPGLKGLTEQAGVPSTLRTEFDRLAASGRAFDVGPTENLTYAQDISDAYDIARTLSDLNTQIATRGQGIPTATPVGQAALVGAAQGFAVGGPVGAAVGAFGGAIRAQGEQKAESKAKAQVNKAQAAVSPLSFLNTAFGALPQERAIALATGAGQDTAQDIQLALARSGFRDSALGTLSSLAAASQPGMAARGRAINTTLRGIGQNAASILNRPIDIRDRLSETLAGLTTAYLTFAGLKQTGQGGGSRASLLPGGEDLFRSERPMFEIPNQEEFLPK